VNFPDPVEGFFVYEILPAIKEVFYFLGKVTCLAASGRSMLPEVPTRGRRGGSPSQSHITQKTHYSDNMLDGRRGYGAASSIELFPFPSFACNFKPYKEEYYDCQQRAVCDSFLPPFPKISFQRPPQWAEFSR
jgi:hypothetical protein